MTDESCPAVPIRASAAVILVRPRGDGPALEILLLRRHRKASFMSSSYVFPGGVAEPDEDDLRVTAARELFEEAGVLLVDGAVDETTRLAWRATVHQGARLSELLAGRGMALDPGRLSYFARWITPSVQPRRYDATFFVATLPAGQIPSFDDRETVHQVWVTPAEALERAGELRLPPPQVRTMMELADACAGGMPALAALCEGRARTPHPILPRRALGPLQGVTLLLPWDPDYERSGDGDGLPIPCDHPLARGASRFVLEDGTWKNVAPPSTTVV